MSRCSLSEDSCQYTVLCTAKQNLLTYIHEDSAKKTLSTNIGKRRSQNPEEDIATANILVANSRTDKIRDDKMKHIKQTYKHIQALDKNIKVKEETWMYYEQDNGTGERRMP